MGTCLCEHCTAVCCHYISLEIDEPETPRDFDDIRWYLLHDGISVYVDGGRWYLQIETRCRELQPDGRCGIYPRRPAICREYRTDNCDYHSGAYDYEHYFDSAEKLEAYVREHFARRPRRRRASRNGAARLRRPSGNGRSLPVIQP